MADHEVVLTQVRPPAVASPSPTPWPAARTRARWRTPVVLRAFAGATTLLALVLAGAAVVAVGNARDGVESLGRNGPAVVSTSNLSFALSDMDAQLANVLLVADRADLGISRAKALQIYQERRGQVSGYLQQVATLSGTGPDAAGELRRLLDGLGSYERYAGQAILVTQQSPGRPGRPSPAALDLYRQATDLMHDELLPAAARLVDAAARVVERQHGSSRGAVAPALAVVLGVGLALLAVLAGLQVFLRRRYRRLVNPGAALASLAVVAFLIAATSMLLDAREDLRAVKKDAFDSILALSWARAVSYDANADESRYLLDPQRASRYEQAFADKSRQLADLGPVGVAGYDAALTQSIDRYHTSGTVSFDGLYGRALRNITFAGERAAAQATLECFQRYQRADRQIRALNTAGDLEGAIRFGVSYAPGDSNYLFDSYDQALVAFIGINQAAFDRLVTRARGNLSGWTWIAPAWLAAVVVLVLAGLRPRLAEYRT